MWLHCNKCGVLKSENNTVKFFVGICSHVLCEECNLSKTCPIHKRTFNGIEINYSMPQKMRAYFEDPNKLLISWQKCIRFQCEQRDLCESREWSTITEHTRKLKEEINVLNKFKGAAIQGIEKDTKCINKMKAYIMNLQKRKDQPHEFIDAHSINTTTSTLSTSALSLNASNAIGESVVDMDFDYDVLSRSN